MSTRANASDNRPREAEAITWVYFALAFAISWGAILWIVGLDGLPGRGDAFQRLGMPVAGLMILGPAAAGIGLTWIREGLRGLGALASAQARWRVDVRYYAMGLLTVPTTAAVVLLILSWFDPRFAPGVLSAPEPLTVLGFALFGGIFAGFVEEIGWTGFAVRKLLSTRTVLAAALMIGVLHGIWHLLAGYWGEGDAFGAWFVPYFVLHWIGGVTALRVLIVWLFRRTESLLIAQLAHFSYTGGLLLLGPSGLEPSEITLWMSLFSVALWLVLAVVIGRNREDFLTRAATPTEQG